MSISRVLREKLMDEVEDDNKPAGGGPAPGETQEAYDLKQQAEDRGDVVTEPDADDKTDDKKAAADDKKADDTKATDDKDADKKDDKDEKDTKVSIPKFRYDAAAARARKAEEKAAAAEARIQELLGQKPPQGATQTPTGDEPLTVAQAEDRILAIDDELEEAVEADDSKKMLMLMREQRELRDGIYDVQLEQATKSGTTAAVNDVQLDRVITEIEEQIPVLNPNSETYDDVLAVETLELADALELKGNTTPAEAMMQAVEYMSSKLGEGAAEAVADAKSDPKKTDLERNKKVADSTTDLPGSKGGSDSDKAGLAADKPNIASMSDKEFNTMVDESPEEHARLRGDFG